MSQINNLQKQWKKFLTKKMDRKEFLAHLGAGAFAATGIAALFKSFDGASADTSTRTGYGGGAYGGSSDASAA